MANQTVSTEQIEALIDFLEGNRDTALSRQSRSKEGRVYARRQWDNVANILNSVTNGASKTSDQWRLYYNEYKSKVIKKVKAINVHETSTGKPCRKLILTPLQNRLYNILKEDNCDPLSKQPKDEMGQTSAIKQEIQEEFSVIIEADDSLASDDNLELPQSPLYSCKVRVSSPSEASSEGPVSDGDKNTSRPTADRPRRKRRRSERSEEDPSIREATESIRSMEVMRAEATRVLAHSTLELARAQRDLADTVRRAADTLAGSINTLAAAYIKGSRTK